MYKPSLVIAAGILAAGSLTVAGPADAAAHLVRDINSSSASANASVGFHAELGNLVLFGLDDGVHGQELWASDGSAAGTRLVRDINPGPAGADMNSFTVLNGAAYFWADDGTNGVELWRSDGTTAGTAIVANIGPGAIGFGGVITFSRAIAAHGGVLYFMAEDAQSGPELWRSDGTREGTYRLADINPGAAGSEPTDFTTAGAHLFFVANDGVHGRELWRTDGTVSGTRLVADISPGSTDGVAGLFGVAVAGNALYFGASDGTHGLEPWRATADSASMIVDLNTRPDPVNPSRNGDSSPHDFLPAGDRAVFIAQEFTQGTFAIRLYRVTGDHSLAAVMDMQPFDSLFELARVSNRTLFRFGQSGGDASELWVTDGSAAGTAPLRPGGVSLYASGTSLALERTDTEAFFYANTTSPLNGDTIWRSDGTSAGTRELATLPEPVIAGELARLGNTVFFHAGRFTDPAGDELWVTDGTPASTRRISDINPGPGHAGIGGMFAAIGKVFFQANDGVSGGELWVSDGTAAGTVGLGDLNSTIRSQGSEPEPMVPFGNGMLLVADDGVTGRELWFSDGSSVGTRRVADINPGAASSMPSSFVALAGFVLFVADDGASGRELWRSDGTTLGTRQVADIAPGPAHGADTLAFGAAVLNGVAYFEATDGTNGLELWRSNGTAAGTFMVADLSPGSAASNATMMTTVGQRVLFRYQNSEPGRLWSTDGTPAGTVQVTADLDVRSLLSFDVAVLSGRLYFAGRDPQNDDEELWSSDGTAAGTHPVTDLSPNASLFVSGGIQATDTALVFNGCITGQGCGLYSSDGTNAGTHRIFDGSARTAHVRDGARMFFAASQSGVDRIFVTDGSVAGTRLYTPASVDLGGAILGFTWFSDTLVFTVNDAQRGPVIWRSDGTQAGTQRILDIDPGVEADRPPGGYMAAGARLFFSAGHVDLGNELYALENDRPLTSPDVAHAGFNSTIRIGVLDNDATLSGTLVRSSLQLVGNPQSGAATVDTASGEILYTPNAGFTGTDTLSYRVRDDQGRISDSTTVLVVVGAVEGGGPGTAPTPPPPPPPPAPPPNNPGNSGGGGGGAFNWLLVIALASVRAARRRRTR